MTGLRWAVVKICSLPLIRCSVSEPSLGKAVELGNARPSPLALAQSPLEFLALSSQQVFGGPAASLRYQGKLNKLTPQFRPAHPPFWRVTLEQLCSFCLFG